MPLGHILEVLAYGGRTDDVMKLLVIGFEGLSTFVIHRPEGQWHAISR